MPSFDIVNQIDLQEVDNALNTAKKEILTRYDFRGSKTEIEFNKKEKNIHVVSEDKMKMEAIRDIFLSKAIKRSLDVRSFQFGDIQDTHGGLVKRDVKIAEGIEKELARKIVKLIKDSKLKVSPAIQEDMVRVTGKKIDDLQEVIQMLKGQEFEIPLQYVNMRS